MKYQVSIIIPIYNVQDYIADSLLSALNQTFESIEYILVDDCSADDSIAIAKKVINQHSRKQDVYIYKHDQNRGLSAARNTGLSNATAEYVFFMDSDDEILLDCIEKHYEEITNKRTSFTVADMVLSGAKSIHIVDMPDGLDEMKPLLSFFRKKWNISACNKLYLKEFLSDNNLRFHDGLMHEDVLWSYKLALYALNIGFVKGKTYIYKVRSGSITSQKGTKKVENILYILKTIMEDYEKGLICKEYYYDMCRFIDFWRFNSALLLLNSTKNISERKKFLELIKKTNKYKCVNLYSILLKMPFFLIFAKPPYILYKKIAYLR